MRQNSTSIRLTGERQVIGVMTAQVPGRDSETEITRMMECHGAMLARLCTALLGDPDLAQDVVQETFMKAYRMLIRHGKCIRDEHAWLAKVAVNLCRDQWRSNWFRHVDRRVSLDMLPEPTAPVDEQDIRIFEAVQMLPGKLREVVLLRYYQDMGVAELSQTLGVSRATAYRRLEQALSSLQDIIEGEIRDE